MAAKVSALMRWVGPLAIVGALFAVVSDQLGLVVHLPEVGDDALGYHAVGSGIFLFVATLLFIGMLGLYAGAAPRRDGAKLIEYGDAHTRYVLVEEGEPGEEPRAADKVVGGQSHHRDGLRDTATRRQRMSRHVGR